MKVEYYTLVGSYDGAVKIGGKWVRANSLNRVDKRGWKRRSGKPTAAITKALREQPAQEATDLFPDRVKYPKPTAARNSPQRSAPARGEDSPPEPEGVSTSTLAQSASLRSIRPLRWN